MKKNIAIIGGGGAGAIAAWALKKVHNITLFEKEESLGGHAYSHPCENKGKNINIDMGVEYFSEKTAPNFYALLDHFNIETFVAPLSFGAAFDKNEMYWSNMNDSGKLWKKLSWECDRFHIHMHQVMHSGNTKFKKMNINQFLHDKKYSSDFTYKALFPLLTTFSSCRSPLEDYSLIFCALSFSMGLLSFFHPSYWRKSKGGIKSYLEIIEQDLKGQIHFNCAVEKIVRNHDCVKVLLRNGKSFNFDEIIFATHADVTLSLLDNPSSLEKEILGGFEYSFITSILHKNTSILAPNFKNRPYIEYNSINQNSDHNFTGSLTRISNHLDIYQNVDTPLLVTFDPCFDISSRDIIVQKKWKIPKLRPIDMFRKTKITQIQGNHRTWYCGTDTSYTGHEGAILSGLVIANHLGAEYPFKDNEWAKIQFKVVKGLMGIYSQPEQINNFFASKIHLISKKFGLHKSQISKVILDMYT